MLHIIKINPGSNNRYFYGFHLIYIKKIYEVIFLRSDLFFRILKLKSPLMKGEDVIAVQRYLLSCGYSLGRFGVDGVYGRSTKEAIKAFQEANGLTIDGITGRDTFRAMGMRWIG